MFFLTERLGIAKLCMIALAVALREASFYKTKKEYESALLLGVQEEATSNNNVDGAILG